jgi:hypothetical protein
MLFRAPQTGLRCHLRSHRLPNGGHLNQGGNYGYDFLLHSVMASNGRPASWPNYVVKANRWLLKVRH